MATLRAQGITWKQAESHEVVMPLLKAMYEEFKVFGKKKPNGALGKNKIAVVNRLLEQCCVVLQSEASLAFLDLLDEDDVPQNSDVVLTLSQYVVAMEQFKKRYWTWDKEWFISD